MQSGEKKDLIAEKTMNWTLRLRFKFIDNTPIYFSLKEINTTVASCCRYEQTGSFNKEETWYLHISQKPSPNPAWLTVSSVRENLSTGLLLNVNLHNKWDKHNVEHQVSTFCCCMVSFCRSLVKGKVVFLRMLLPVL